MSTHPDVLETLRQLEDIATRAGIWLEHLEPLLYAEWARLGDGNFDSQTVNAARDLWLKCKELDTASKAYAVRSGSLRLRLENYTHGDIDKP